MVVRYTNSKTTPNEVYLLPSVKHVAVGEMDCSKWLEERCAGDVWISAMYMYFKNEQDAILFRLSFNL